MNFKRASKTIFGVELNAAEQKALDLEIQKELAEYDRKNCIALDSVVLWHLYTHDDFDYDRLKSFYMSLVPEIDKFINYYEMGKADSAWLCVQKLKDIGVDVEKWYDEYNNKEV